MSGCSTSGRRASPRRATTRPSASRARTQREFPGLGKPQAVDAATAATGTFHGALDDADPNKQKAFVESITSGKLINEAQSGADSALAGILGRTAAYTGRKLTWDELMKSTEVWDPKIDLKQFA